MAQSKTGKKHAPQKGHRIKKSGGQSGGSGYNEGINRQKLEDPYRRGGRKNK